MSYNRPHYLKEVLESLKSQNLYHDDLDITLFQDYPVEDENLNKNIILFDECINIFKEFFPKGNLQVAKNNLGVALNFNRAEKSSFEKKKVDFCIFLEDDLILRPKYLNMMLRLWSYVENNPQIGLFSCYGHLTLDEAEMIRRKSEIQGLEHHWAFAMTKFAYFNIRKYLNQYISIVGSVPYRNRDLKLQEISGYFRNMGLGLPATSQDAAKSMFLHLVGMIKINTVKCYGEYIGRAGLHLTEEEFIRQGFAKTIFIDDEEEDLLPLSDQQINTIKTQLKDYATSNFEAIRLLNRLKGSMTSGHPINVFTEADIFYKAFPFLFDEEGAPLFLKMKVKVGLTFMDRKEILKNLEEEGFDVENTPWILKLLPEIKSEIKSD